MYRVQKLNAKRTNNPENELVFKKEIQMANKFIKKCSLSLPIKKFQTKTILRFHLIQSDGYHQENKQQNMARMLGRGGLKHC
jgi:hypothetical protein